MSSNILTVRVQRLVTVVYEADIDVAEGTASELFANALSWTEAQEAASKFADCYLVETVVSARAMRSN